MMKVEPKVRGFICTTAHPVGCHAHVKEQIEYVKQHKTALSNAPKKVLVIGASTGYGLASRIVASFGAGASTIGVFFEKEASGKRTASAGWYNSAAFEQEAQQAGLYAKSLNGDAFSAELKQQVIDLIKQDWEGQVDLIVYSLASPRRTDPISGETFNSVLKPVGEDYTDKTVNVMSGEVSTVSLPPASEEEILHTEKVMGGEDWAYWIDALAEAGVLAPKAMTVAYSYIGPEMTYPIYREGTIGKAKEHLEKTAVQLSAKLAAHCEGRALVSVNKGLVTQASSAIPVVPLYMSLLYKVMKEKNIHEGCIEQITRLFCDRLYTESEIPVDSKQRIRLDDWEMRDDVQAEVAKLWTQVQTENLEAISDIQGYREAFYQLFGFQLAGVDYNQEIDVQIQVPSIQLETA